MPLCSRTHQHAPPLGGRGLHPGIPAMMTIRKSAERGAVNHGWLDTKHTFSFGDYYDPAHHHYRSLRVINDDRVAGGAGFPTHPHRDMEIITYMLAGQLQHADSMGTGSIIRTGEVQYMSAGSGVTHSEFNPSKTEPAHLLQIWIVPDKKGYAPRYEQKSFADAPSGNWTAVMSPDGKEGSMAIRQDAKLFLGRFKTGDSLNYELADTRGAWLHVAKGSVKVNGLKLTEGDAVAIEGEPKIELVGVEAGEVLLFDLA